MLVSSFISCNHAPYLFWKEEFKSEVNLCTDPVLGKLGSKYGWRKDDMFQEKCAAWRGPRVILAAQAGSAWCPVTTRATVQAIQIFYLLLKRIVPSRFTPSFFCFLMGLRIQFFVSVLTCTLTKKQTSWSLSITLYSPLQSIDFVEEIFFHYLLDFLGGAFSNICFNGFAWVACILGKWKELEQCSSNQLDLHLRILK